MNTPIRKKPSTYRLAQMTEMQIDKLADQLGMSRANVIQTAVDRLYREERQNMNYEKVLTCTAGNRENPVHATVEFSGTLDPAAAKQAARKAFGHADGVTVVDTNAGYGYRLTNGKARKFTT